MYHILYGIKKKQERKTPKISKPLLPGAPGMGITVSSGTDEEVGCTFTWCHLGQMRR